MFKEIFKLQEETDGGDATSYVSGGAVAPATADQSADGLDAAQWGALGESFDADESDESVTVEGDLAVERTEEKGEQPQPLESPVNPVTPVQSDQSSPVVPPATPTQIAAPETPTQPVAPPEVYQSWKVAREKELESLYALNEEDAQAALTEPEKLLPRMAAKLHIGVLEASVRAMQAMMPVMLNQVTQATELNTRAKNLFQSINPDLADPRYEPHILELGQLYRTRNQTASPEEAARVIGDLVRVAFGLTRTPPTQQQAAQPTPPATPFSPVRGGGVKVGGQVKPLNPFDALDREFDEDEF